MEQRGGNIMDKGSNEAERERGGERKERRTGGKYCGGGKRTARREGGREEESRGGGGRGRGSKGMCLTASFSHAPSVLVRLTQAP